MSSNVKKELLQIMDDVAADWHIFRAKPFPLLTQKEFYKSELKKRVDLGDIDQPEANAIFEGLMEGVYS